MKPLPSDTPLPESGHLPYVSFEFAGVHGPKRALLGLSRRSLMSFVISPIQEASLLSFCDLVVLTEELYERHVKRYLTKLPRTELRPAIVALKDHRRFLCSIDNGIYLTDVEGYNEGIPFRLEDIASIKPTRHYVTLKTMQRRKAVLAERGLSSHMTNGALPPGNY